MGKYRIDCSRPEEWQELVVDAQRAADCPLDEHLEQYLVGTLMRYARRSDLADSIMALSFLEGQATLSQERLRDVGDQCLLFSGLFPGRARRRLVPVSYYVNTGRNAYHHLAHIARSQHAEMFDALSRAFVTMMDVLLTMRELGDGRSCLDPVCAYELWNDTGSRHALKALREVTDGMPCAGRRGVH